MGEATDIRPSPEAGGIARWLLDGSIQALERICAHAARVGLANTDEATFRSFFMAAVCDGNPSARFETEWRRFDLLVQIGPQVTLVEFKYYVHRRTSDFDGKPGPWKGGAGVQNESEFWTCVQKLRAYAHAQISERYLVLVYEREASATARKTFGASYDALTCKEGVAELVVIERPPLICKILRI